LFLTCNVEAGVKIIVDVNIPACVKFHEIRKLVKPKNTTSSLGPVINFILHMYPFLKKGCPGWWGANLGPVNFIYFLIFTTLHTAEPQLLHILYVSFSTEEFTCPPPSIPGNDFIALIARSKAQKL
jgi:hypothetical protein